jgi:hypothetical protein
MPETVKMVAVHYANRSGRGKAAFFLPYEAARDLVDARMAVWSKGAKYLNLTKTEAEMPKPAPSLSPNIRIMEAYVDRKPYAVSIIEAYKHRYAA